jgi:hypothetical protein
MKNKKNFRIKRSSKIDELVTKNQLLQKTLKKITGGVANQVNGAYGRLAGYHQEVEL